MQALVYTGVEQLEIREVPDPVPAEGEVLVRIDSSGICGSDMHAFLGHDARRPAPLILGHEAAGVTSDGRRVTINPLVTNPGSFFSKTGRDNLCPDRQIISMKPREGAFAPMVALPEGNLVEVPDHVPLSKAALAEPLAVSWHAVVMGLARMHPDDERRCLVIGGGAIGLAAALAWRALTDGEVVIVEPNDTRREYLNTSCGVTAVAEASGDWPCVLDAVGYAATREVACARVTPGGVVVHVGLGQDTGGVDVRRLTLQEITFVGTYTYTAQDFRDCAQALFDGRLGPLDWVEERPLSEGHAAFQDIRAGRVAAPKIILKPL